MLFSGQKTPDRPPVLEVIHQNVCQEISGGVPKPTQYRQKAMRQLVPLISTRTVFYLSAIAVVALLASRSIPTTHANRNRPSGHVLARLNTSAAPPAALTLIVNTLGDQADASPADGICDTNSGTTGDQCTLRAAIQGANATVGSDSITFSLPANSTIVLITGLPDISDHVTLTGPGPASLTVTRSTAGGTPDFRIFKIGVGKTVSISGMTISGGRAPVADSDGGGIMVQQLADVTLTSVQVTGNASANASLSRAGFGGGIWNDGVLKLINCTISNNVTGKGGFGGPSNGGDGGGIYNAAHGTLTILSSTLTGNDTGVGVFNGSLNDRNGNGAGINNSSGGSASIINSTITNNVTGTASGSIRGQGGGIMSQGQLQLSNCTVTNNTAVNTTGGGILASGSPAGIRNTMVANNIGGSSPDLAGVFNSQDYNLFKNTSGASFTNSGTHDIIGQDPALASLANNGGPTQTRLPLPGSPVINAGNPANLPPDTFDLNNNGNTTEPLPVDQRGFERVAETKVDIGAVETNYSAPVLFVEEGTNRLAAVDSVTFVRGPFRVLSEVNFSADKHTRILFFTSNLGMTQPDTSILTVEAGGMPLEVEAVGRQPNSSGLDISYVVVKLADGLPVGNIPLTVTLRGSRSFSGTIGIAP